jgi:hypothetical protein
LSPTIHIGVFRPPNPSFDATGEGRPARVLLSAYVTSHRRLPTSRSDRVRETGKRANAMSMREDLLHLRTHPMPSYATLNPSSYLI